MMLEGLCVEHSSAFIVDFAWLSHIKIKSSKARFDIAQVGTGMQKLIIRSMTFAFGEITSQAVGCAGPSRANLDRAGFKDSQGGSMPLLCLARDTHKGSVDSFPIVRASINQLQAILIQSHHGSNFDLQSQQRFGCLELHTQVGKLARSARCYV